MLINLSSNVKRNYFLKALFIALFFASANLIALTPIDTLTFNDESIPGKALVLVFTPQNLTGAEIPAVFLLHGWSGDAFDWTKNVDLQKISDTTGMIIICPEGFYDSWYVNSTVSSNHQIESFFVETLYPTLRLQYPLSPENVFITGLSMGGHGALLLALKYPSIFAAAGSMSGILDITAFPKNWGIAKRLGDYNKNKTVWENNSVINLLGKPDNLNLPLFVDCGKDDFAFKVNQDFAAKAKKLGHNLIFLEKTGTHDWKFWTSSIYEHLNFFLNQIK